MTTIPPPLLKVAKAGSSKHFAWFFLLGAIVAGASLCWYWACFSDPEGPGSGFAVMFWLLIQLALTLLASLFAILGFFTIRGRLRWLALLILVAAWWPAYGWLQTGHVPGFHG